MKFAVIGCGSIGRRHIGNLLALGHEVVAWNRGETRRSRAATEFGVEVYADPDEMLNEGGANAAVICSPNTRHVADAMMAAKTSHHLFVEKPLSASADGIQELIAESAARGLVSHVGCNLRFHFGPARIKRLIESGALGRILWAGFWAAMYLPDWHPDEDYRRMYSARRELGGGALLDYIHEIDIALWFFGVPERVAAMTAHTGVLEIETEDVADILLKFAGGLQVNLHLDYLQRPYQRGVRILGEKGWASWDLAREGVETFDYGTNEGRFEPHPEGYEHNDMYVEQMKYFIRCVEEGRPSMCDLGAGRAALDVALRCKRSAAQATLMEAGA